MNDIFEKIDAARTNFRSKSINPPNVIYMNMADYRALYEWAKTTVTFRKMADGSLAKEFKKNETPKPTEILGMRIVKKSRAKLECTFEETQPTKEYTMMEAVRKAADSMRKAGARLPKRIAQAVQSKCTQARIGNAGIDN